MTPLKLTTDDGIDEEDYPEIIYPSPDDDDDDDDEEEEDETLWEDDL